MSTPRCTHRGAQTGERLPCASCRGRVQIVVYQCAIHGECTIGRRVKRDGKRLACCQRPRRCSDFRA